MRINLFENSVEIDHWDITYLNNDVHRYLLIYYNDNNIIVGKGEFYIDYRVKLWFDFGEYKYYL